MLPTEAFSCVSFKHSPLLDIAPAEGVTLEPMTLRFVRLEGVDEVICQQVIGPKTGKLTTNFYNRQNMWAAIAPLFPHLEEITKVSGTLLHLACVCAPYKSTVLRNPVLLVETTNLEDKAAANWSRRNLFASKLGDEHDIPTYIRYIATRNAEWLEKYGIKEAQSSPLDAIISLIRSGDITQNELISALNELR